MKNGYPPIVIRTENRFEYYSALDKVHTTRDNKDFIEIGKEEVDRPLDLYLKVI